MALTVGSLFSGIGGIDLGLERAGMESRWFVEIDPHCRNVLARHWPGLPIYGDITSIDWSGVEPVDVLAGGFPCQPVSAAGLRKAQDDERWLWPEFARAIRVLRPRYVLLENVRNLLAVNDGSAASEVHGDLAALGYDTDGDCLQAADVGAPHERERVFIVAYTPSDGRSRGRSSNTRRDDPTSGSQRFRAQPTGEGPSPREVADTSGVRRSKRRAESTWKQGRSGPAVSRDAMVDATGARLQRSTRQGLPGERRTPVVIAGRSEGEGISQPRMGRVLDGIPRRLDGYRWPAPPGPQYEWEPPRTIAHRLPYRVARIKALGNAVVPQVVEWIGRRIVAFDEEREVRAA